MHSFKLDKFNSLRFLIYYLTVNAYKKVDLI